MGYVLFRFRKATHANRPLAGRRHFRRRPRFERLEDRRALSGLISSLDDPHRIDVMTQNIYIGADLAPVLEAAQEGDQMAIASAVGQLWGEIHERDFPARAETFAAQIAQGQPALIGLQEVSQFVAGNIYHPQLDGSRIEEPQTAETIDYLEILMGELGDQGLSYTVVATTYDFGGPFTALLDPTTFAFQDIQYVDRDVILARSDLPAAAMMLSNVQTGNFAASVPLNLGGTTVPILRGWNSVDVQLWGQDFRFVNTHLEDGNPLIPAFGQVQEAQAAELVAAGGPMDTQLPVILVGDFNSPADRTGTDSYSLLVDQAGFTDAWSVVHPGEPGYTWSQNDDLRGDPVTADPPPEGVQQRIDLILYRDGMLARSVDRVLDPVTPNDPTTGPLWPSDHAGVAATISLQVTAKGEDQPWTVVNDDPLRPGEQALFVVGSDRRDNIEIEQRRNGDVLVKTSLSRHREVYHPTLGGHIYVQASDGNDSIRLSKSVSRDAVIYAGVGNDFVYSGSGDDEIHGGDGNDWLHGGCGDDSIWGEDGNDFLFGEVGNDLLDGGDGNDSLFGGHGNDRLFGGAGRDRLYGESGEDELDGGDGFDWLFGGPGKDKLLGGERIFS